MKVSAILAFRLVTAAPERLAAFYVGLGFQARAPAPISPDELAVLGLAGSGTRRPFHLGDQLLDLDCFEPRGAPYLAGIDGADTRFQHIAIVTNDAAASWARAQSLGATPISAGGPVTLPPSSGGVTAIKFRDPEGHPLEFLQFPRNLSESAGRGGVGLDHSAISVADLEQALAFYGAWGLKPGKRTSNHGPTQASLDDLDRARVDVAPMAPALKTPHLELLAYRTPRSRRAPPWAVNDVVATRIVWAANQPALRRDPDGHLHQLTLG